MKGIFICCTSRVCAHVLVRVHEMNIKTCSIAPLVVKNSTRYFRFLKGIIFIYSWKICQKSNWVLLCQQSPWESGPESRRSSWTSISRAPSLHRKSQSGEMESLLSDTHTSSNLSSREQSLDQADYLQVPMMYPPDCNGTTFHLPEHCFDDAPLATHYHSDQEEEEAEEVFIDLFIHIFPQWKGILMVFCMYYSS